MKGMPALVVIVAVLGIASLSLFTVYETDQAILLRLGRMVQEDLAVGEVDGQMSTEPTPRIYHPGLHFKVPFIDSVKSFDTRLNMLDVQSSRIMTSEKKDVLVDFYVQWRIDDLALFFTRAQGRTGKAEQLLEQKVIARLKAEFGKRTINDVISGERDQIMDLMRNRVDDDAEKIGVEVLDVRLKRVDLTSEISEAVYRRMEAERKRVANELRSLGFAEAEKIKAQADREAEVIVAKGYKEAQNIKGFGDAKSAEIYGKAFSKDQNFYAFYRRLQAYEDSFQEKSDFIILDFDNDFFKFMQKPR